MFFKMNLVRRVEMLAEWGTRTCRRHTAVSLDVCVVATDVSCACLWFKRTLSTSFPSPSTTIYSGSFIISLQKTRSFCDSAAIQLHELELK